MKLPKKAQEALAEIARRSGLTKEEVLRNHRALLRGNVAVYHQNISARLHPET